MIVDTPCIGICSSVYGDPICRGCKRTAAEVIAWNQYTVAQKALVYQRLQADMTAILSNYIEVIDSALLQEKILQLKIRLHPRAGPIEQAFHILRLGSNKIKNLEKFGLQMKAEVSQMSLSVLFDQMDTELYARSCLQHLTDASLNI